MALEGEAFLLTGAYLASRGFFHLELVMLVALASNTAADQIYYTLARSKGKPWLDAKFGHLPRYQWLMDKIEHRTKAFFASLARLASWPEISCQRTFETDTYSRRITAASRSPTVTATRRAST
ncbi:MAG: hypothetical protein HY238_21265 [Acidobacteria bacterium]|nr:hypothetical protein [Acidobacteriota bacterium]